MFFEMPKADTCMYISLMSLIFAPKILTPQKFLLDKLIKHHTMYTEIFPSKRIKPKLHNMIH